MDPRPVIDALLGHRVEFVVVGSAARFLLGDDIVPADLDLVLTPSLANRDAVMSALIELDTCLVAEDRLVPLTSRSVLPWEWSWQAVTAYGPVDMIVRFIDGSGFDEHHRAGTDVRVGDGHSVRCHGTEHRQ